MWANLTSLPCYQVSTPLNLTGLNSAQPDRFKHLLGNLTLLCTTFNPKPWWRKSSIHLFI